MKDKELYQQKMQARLDEWNAEIHKLKAKSSRASADVQLDINRQIRLLERDIEDVKAKLREIATAGEDAWESIKGGVEDAWGSLKSGVTDAATRLRR
jgi:septal ring factor EnvC (AmiA/AmiB activator)